MTDRIRLDDMTDDALDQLYAENDRLTAELGDYDQRVQQLTAELTALRTVARGYCPACGRGDAAPTVADWEQQRQRADEAEQRLIRIAGGTPHADAVQAEIGEMIAQTHELRDQLRSAEAAIARARAVAGWALNGWSDLSPDKILAALDQPAAAQTTQPRERCGHLSPDTGLSSPRTECVLRPGHAGSHADDVGCRWWPITDQHPA